MRIKLNFPDEYKEEIKDFKTAKFIKDEINLADTFFDDYETYTQEEIDECKAYLGGDKYYYDIDDKEAEKVLLKSFDEMNDLEIEIWYLFNRMNKPEKADPDKYYADTTDEFLKDQEFLKYRRDKIDRYSFYYFYPLDEESDYWNEGTPEDVIKRFNDKILRKLRRCVDKYNKIIEDTF